MRSPLNGAVGPSSVARLSRFLSETNLRRMRVLESWGKRVLQGVCSLPKNRTETGISASEMNIYHSARVVWHTGRLVKESA
jgi:hypothetical protein